MKRIDNYSEGEDRGTCPYCLNLIPLDKDTRIKEHRVIIQKKHFMRCFGSDKQPLETSDFSIISKNIRLQKSKIKDYKKTLRRLENYLKSPTANPLAKEEIPVIASWIEATEYINHLCTNHLTEGLLQGLKKKIKLN